MAPAFDSARAVTSAAPRIISRGHRPRTIWAGAPTFSVHPRRAGVEARPYGGLGRYQRRTGVVRRPKAGRRGRRPLRAVCLLYVAAYNVRAQPAHHFLRAQSRCPSSHAGRAWKPAPTRHPHLTHVGTNPSVTPQCGATAPLSGEPRASARRRVDVVRRPAVGGRKKDRSADRSFFPSGPFSAGRFILRGCLYTRP